MMNALRDHYPRIVTRSMSRAVQRELRIRQLKQLETWLGDDHSLVVLRATILEAPARFGNERMTAVILGCVAKYQTTLRWRALKRGRQLFASTSSAFRTPIDRWWREGRARST